MRSRVTRCSHTLFSAGPKGEMPLSRQASPMNASIGFRESEIGVGMGGRTTGLSDQRTSFRVTSRPPVANPSRTVLHAIRRMRIRDP